MTETTSMKEACSCCGSSTWTEAHYTGGSLVCAACCAEIRRASEKGQPKPAPKQTALADWLAPRGARP
jgi:hypothetical protein